MTGPQTTTPKRGRSRGGGPGRSTRRKLEREGPGYGEKPEPEQLAGEPSGDSVENTVGDEVGELPPSGTPNAQKDSQLATDSSELTAEELKKKKKKKKDEKKKKKKKEKKQVDQPVGKEATDAEAASAEKAKEPDKSEAAVAGEKTKGQEKWMVDPHQEEEAAAQKPEKGMPDAHKEPVAADMVPQANLSKDVVKQSSPVPFGTLPHTIESDHGTATLFRREEDDSYSVKVTKGKRSTSRESGSLLSGGTSSDSSSRKTPKRVYKHSEFVQEPQSTAESAWVGGRKMEHQRQDFESGSVPDRFKKFLERYVKSKGLDSTPWPTPGVQDEGPEQKEKKYYYKKFVGFMLNLDDLVFEVNFDHIMEDDFQLAKDIVNNSTHQELQHVACSFAMEQVSSIELKDKLQWMTLKFLNRPESIVAVSDLLEDPAAALAKFPNMLGEGKMAATLSELVMALFGGFAEYTFGMHRICKRSWNGTFDITHMFVIDHWRYVIVKKPELVLEGDERLQFLAQKGDLCRLPQIFTPFLDSRQPEDRSEGQPPTDSDLPLFYPQLREAIQAVSAEEMKADWYSDYIIHFPALKPSIARHDFVCDAHLVLKKQGIPLGLYQVVSQMPLKDGADWRDIKGGSSAVLKQVYTYNRGNKAAAAGSGGSKAAAAGSGGSKAAAAGSGGSKEPFSHNMRGLISYDRHLRQHASDTVATATIAELDAFSSTELVVYLPIFLKKMLEKKLMETGEFRDIWAQYKSSRIRTTDGGELKLGRWLSFWT